MVATTSVGVLDGVERHEDDAVGELVAVAERDRLGEPGLPDSSRRR